MHRLRRMGWRLVGFAAGVLVLTVYLEQCTDVKSFIPISESAAD